MIGLVFSEGSLRELDFLQAKDFGSLKARALFSVRK
jgi:hypothetical protein